MILILALTGAARAERQRVVVLELTGSSEPAARSEVVRALKKDFLVIATKKWKQTAAQLGASSLSARNVRTVARKLRVDAVIEGTVHKRRGTRELELRVRSGSTGQVVSTSKLTLDGTRFSKRSKRAFEERVVEKIESLRD